jgi:WD40 repeat protein
MDGTGNLWKVDSGELVHSFPGHESMVTGLSFHERGKFLTTVTVDGALTQWDLTSGKRRQTLQSQLGPILNPGFGPGFGAEGERLTALGKDGVVRVWETKSGREVYSSPQKPFYLLTTFLSPDGTRLAMASFATIRVYDIKSRQMESILVSGFHIVHYMAFSADGRKLAAALWDGTVKVWDIKTRELLHTFRHSDRVTCVAFHPNGHQLASGSCDNTAKVWDLETGAEIETLRGHIGYVMALAYSGDGKLLATSSGHRYQGEVQLWDTESFGKDR